MQELMTNPEQAICSHFQFTPNVAGVDLVDVHVVTAKSNYIDQVHIAAAEHVVSMGGYPSRDAIIEASKITVDDVSVFTTEHVLVEPNNVSVCINVDTIKQSHFHRICDMVDVALQKLQGSFGVIHLSDPMQFDILSELHLAS